jgi:hypothetical protein
MSSNIEGLLAVIIVILLILGMLLWAYGYIDESKKNIGGNMMFLGILGALGVAFFANDEPKKA